MAGRRPWFKTNPPKNPRSQTFVGWDLETTLIPVVKELRSESHTDHAKPLCISWCDERGSGIELLDGDRDLALFMLKNWFTKERVGVRYVSWNGNRFDSRIAMRALASCSEAMAQLVIKPCAASQGIRLVQIYTRAEMLKEKPKPSWFLLDGKAMTGIGASLADFASKFCPDFPKLDIGLADAVAFDGSREDHRSYAIRDAEIVYHGIRRANVIVTEAFGRPLRATIGAAAIRVFGDNLPKDVKVWATFSQAADRNIRMFLRRGGLVEASRYKGPAWGVDQVQAYAGIMREIDLPAGKSRYVKAFVEHRPGYYLAYIYHEERQNVPFPCCDYAAAPKRVLVNSRGEGVLTWITSDEVRSLRSCGWTVNIRYGYAYTQKFRMPEFVEKCETLRNDPAHGGPKSAVGEMVKAMGCNAFGKTLEVVPRQDIVYAAERPGSEWVKCPFDSYGEGAWIRAIDPTESLREYHMPQIGAFITAGVRCKQFVTANLDAENFIGGDTDSLYFKAPLPKELQLTTNEYGKFKVTCEAAPHIFIAKKVYINLDTGKSTCKGLRTSELTVADYERWYETGEPPTQTFVSLINYRQAQADDRMYRLLTRRGTDPRKHGVRGWEFAV